MVIITTDTIRYDSHKYQRQNSLTGRVVKKVLSGTEPEDE